MRIALCAAPSRRLCARRQVDRQPRLRPSRRPGGRRVQLCQGDTECRQDRVWQGGPARLDRRAGRPRTADLHVCERVSAGPRGTTEVNVERCRAAGTGKDFDFMIAQCCARGPPFWREFFYSRSGNVRSSPRPIHYYVYETAGTVGYIVRAVTPRLGCPARRALTRTRHGTSSSWLCARLTTLRRLVFSYHVRRCALLLSHSRACPLLIELELSYAMEARCRSLGRLLECAARSD